MTVYVLKHSTPHMHANAYTELKMHLLSLAGGNSACFVLKQRKAYVRVRSHGIMP